MIVGVNVAVLNWELANQCRSARKFPLNPDLSPLPLCNNKEE